MQCSWEIVIPNGVTVINSSVFDKCISLKSVNIPSGVTSIGNCAFQYCSNLEIENLEIPSGVTSIGYYAFYECSLIKTVSIPASVKKIGHDAFYHGNKPGVKRLIFEDTTSIWYRTEDWNYTGGTEYGPMSGTPEENLRAINTTYGNDDHYTWYVE